MIPQSGRLADAIMASAYMLLRFLPTEMASAIGSHGLRWNARMARKEAMEACRANLRFHRPQASEAEISAMVDEFYDAVGRVAAEFAVMHRFIPEGRITYSGVEEYLAIAGTRPIIALCVHTGNWEVFAPVFQHIGVQLNSVIQPPDSAFERFIIDRTRKSFGVNTILPDKSGIREAIRVLKANGTLSMFPDEARLGHTMGPLFGRPPHDRGNLAIAARLARLTGAELGVGHCRRVDRCRFHLDFGATFKLPERDGKPDLLADVAFLNSKIEPVIEANIPRWYFLDDSLAPVENAAPRPAELG